MADRENENQRKQVLGRIVLVQEERFRIVDEKGRSYLFDLAHNSSINYTDLLNWSKSGERLSITYEGEPDLDTGVAFLAMAA